MRRTQALSITIQINSIDIVGIIANLDLTFMGIAGNTTEIAPAPNQPTWIELVRNQVNSTAFGVIQIVIHDSRVVQIERTEKVRLDWKPLES